MWVQFLYRVVLLPNLKFVSTLNVFKNICKVRLQYTKYSQNLSLKHRTLHKSFLSSVFTKNPENFQWALKNVPRGKKKMLQYLRGGRKKKQTHPQTATTKNSCKWNTNTENKKLRVTKESMQIKVTCTMPLQKIKPVKICTTECARLIKIYLLLVFFFLPTEHVSNLQCSCWVCCWQATDACYTTEQKIPKKVKKKKEKTNWNLEPWWKGKPKISSRWNEKSAPRKRLSSPCHFQQQRFVPQSTRSGCFNTLLFGFWVEKGGDFPLNTLSRQDQRLRDTVSLRQR